MWRQKATSIVSLRNIVGVVTWNSKVLTTDCIGSTNSKVQLLSVGQCMHHCIIHHSIALS